MTQGKLSMRAALLGLTMLLAGCANSGRETNLGTQTPSDNAATCISVIHIAPNRGKPGGITTEDISAALDRDHPIERIRNLVGDNSNTLMQIDKNNAALAILCGGGGGDRKSVV